MWMRDEAAGQWVDPDNRVWTDMDILLGRRQKNGQI